MALILSDVRRTLGLVKEPHPGAPVNGNSVNGIWCLRQHFASDRMATILAHRTGTDCARPDNFAHYSDRVGNCDSRRRNPMRNLLARLEALARHLPAEMLAAIQRYHLSRH